MTGVEPCNPRRLPTASSCSLRRAAPASARGSSARGGVVRSRAAAPRRGRADRRGLLVPLRSLLSRQAHLRPGVRARSARSRAHPRHHADRGAGPAQTVVTRSGLRRFAAVDIGAGEPRFRRPVPPGRATARRVDPEATRRSCCWGRSRAAKYYEVVADVFGERLLFPPDFVGRGDMSRGGLLLRAARSGEEASLSPDPRRGAQGRPAREAPADPGNPSVAGEARLPAGVLTERPRRPDVLLSTRRTGSPRERARASAPAARRSPSPASGRCPRSNSGS